MIAINYDPSTKTDHHTRTNATWAVHSNQPHAAHIRTKGNSSAAGPGLADFLVLVPTEPKPNDTKKWTDVLAREIESCVLTLPTPHSKSHAHARYSKVRITISMCMVLRRYK